MTYGNQQNDAPRPAKVHPEGSGIIRTNQNKSGNANAPQFKGHATWNGRKVDISLWYMEAQGQTPAAWSIQMREPGPGYEYPAGTVIPAGKGGPNKYAPQQQQPQQQMNYQAPQQGYAPPPQQPQQGYGAPQQQYAPQQPQQGYAPHPGVPQGQGYAPAPGYQPPPQQSAQQQPPQQPNGGGGGYRSNPAGGNLQNGPHRQGGFTDDAIPF